MGIFDKLADRMELVKQVEKENNQKKALKQREIRNKSLPIIKSFTDKYPNVSLKLFDTEVLITINENGHERSMYLPYSTDVVDVDIKIDNFVNNIQSAAKHKVLSAIAKGMENAASYNEGNINSLPQSGQGGSWINNKIDLKNFDTSMTKRK
jgi:hypothetical protein